MADECTSQLQDWQTLAYSYKLELDAAVQRIKELEEILHHEEQQFETLLAIANTEMNNLHERLVSTQLDSMHES